MTLLLGLALAAAADRTVIHAGALIDGTSAKERGPSTIVVEDGRIASIEKGHLDANGAELVDLSDHTVLPGLIDLHTHLAHQLGPGSYQEDTTLDRADLAIRATVHAERTLLAGFTTVRDLGDDGIVVRALRDAVNAGTVPGPRIFTAGKSLATTGGHADPSNGLSPAFRFEAGPEQGVLNGPHQAREAVRHRYQQGADLIKLTATGGVLSLASSGDNPQFTAEELEAVVQTANDYGFRVAVHAHGAEGMKRAVLAGVHTIEHGSYMTPEVMELMKERGTWYVPTLLAGQVVVEMAKAEELPEIVRPKALAVGAQMAGTFAEAVKRGVPIAFGTDCGVGVHGENAKEFKLMVDAGMSPMRALQSATGQAARALGKEADLGTLEPGKRADVIAVAGSPLRDIGVMESVVFVMKDGEVVRQAEAK